jgi:phage tail sheath gpL-like
MPFTQNSIAATTALGMKNKVFAPAPLILQRKIAIIGTYDPAKTSVVANVPERLLSAADAADKYGFGFQLHRLAIQVFQGSQGIETWAIPQAEVGDPAAASPGIDFTGTTITQSGTVYLYIAGERVLNFTVAKDDVASDVATKCADAINALGNRNLPITAISATDVVNLTAKSKGEQGNLISIAFNLNPGETYPGGLATSIGSFGSGTSTPNIQDALDGLGTGDNANEIFITDLIHGYGQDTTTLDAISNYVGAGDDFIGLYAKTVARPFRSLVGDVAIGSAGLTALIAFTDLRKLDRANGVFAVPGSPNHPAEIAAQVMGHMARVNQTRAEESYIDKSLIGIYAGSIDDNWTSEYDNRDLAVKSGISPSFVKNSVITIQNVVSFYRPDSVPVGNNGYRSMRNISILQNIMHTMKATFETEKWNGISIVQHVQNVTNLTSRKKARDIQSMLDELVGLALSFESRAWLYTASFTIEELKKPDMVIIKQDLTGFENTFPVILSGEGGIIDTTVEFDVSIAILLT